MNMEVVLDLYQSQHTEEEPLVCMDEAAVAIHRDVYEPIEIKPGQDALVRLSLPARRDKSIIYVRRSHERMAKS